MVIKIKKLLIIPLILLLITSCGSEIIPAETTIETTAAETFSFVNIEAAEGEETFITLTETVKITKTGTYIVSGTLDDGQIIIDADKKAVVTLVLNGVSITSSVSAPIYAVKAAETVIILADGTENHVADTASDRTSEPNAAIFAKNALTITGGGSLYVTGNHNNGIGTKDELIIAGGNIHVTAANDGIKSNNGASITITDGIFKINAAHDGIQSATSIVISGGSFDITTGGGSIAAPTRQENFRGWQWDNLIPEEEEDTESMKAIKIGTSLIIEGGDFVIDSEDDAINASEDVTISGGSFIISAGDDAIHAGSALRIDGGTIDILTSYEGLEGTSVDITGGEVTLNAQDDGINAAGGSDGESQGPMGFDRFAADSNAYIRISGGSVVIDANGDGIDSNGAIYIDGGDLFVSGPTDSMNSALDSEAGIEINGGNVIAAGSSGMLVFPANSSAQPSIVVYYTQNQSENTEIRLIDAVGNTVISYTPAKMYQSAIISSDQLEIGAVYTLYSDSDELCEITLNSTVTTVTDDGSEVTANRNGGGFGGGRNDRDNNRPPMNQRPNT